VHNARHRTIWARLQCSGLCERRNFCWWWAGPRSEPWPRLNASNGESNGWLSGEQGDARLTCDDAWALIRSFHVKTPPLLDKVMILVLLVLLVRASWFCFEIQVPSLGTHETPALSCGSPCNQGLQDTL
jgi:hypothetical protein